MLTCCEEANPRSTAEVRTRTRIRRPSRLIWRPCALSCCNDDGVASSHVLDEEPEEDIRVLKKAKKDVEKEKVANSTSKGKK